MEKPKKTLPVGRGSLPRGARQCSPRRSQNLKAQNVRPEVVTRTLLGRFHFFSSLLDHLRDKVHLLRHQFLSRTYFTIGERNRPGEALTRPDAHLPGPPGSRLRPTGRLSLGFEVVLVSQF